MRITIRDLECSIDRLNQITGNPLTPYAKNNDGKFKPNAGNYHLSQAYGGCMVARMSMTEGCTGISTPITHGHVTKRECYDTLHAFINGVQSVEGEV